MRTRTLGTALLAAMLALFVLGGPAAAQEEYPPPPTTDDASGPATVQPGTSPTFSASGFGAGTEVTVVLSGVLSGTFSVTANEGGVASFQVSVPCDAAAGPATITFEGTGTEGEARTASTDFTVSDDTAAACEREAPGLAGTGAELTNLGLLAIILLVVGGGLVTYTRQRSRSKELAKR